MRFFRVVCTFVVISAGTLLDPMQFIAWASPDTTIVLSGKPVSYADVVTADFNGDGYKEIVAAGSDGMLYVVSTNDGVRWNVVWSHQCNEEILAAVASAPVPQPYPGKPADVIIYPIDPKATNVIEAAPAVADLDNDGHLEIVVAMGGNIHKEDWNQRGNGGILVYRYVNEWSFQLFGDWPQPKIDRVGKHPGFGYPDGLWDGIMTTPAIGDLDGDGDLEIVVAGIDRRIHAWHHTGEVVAGWPIYRYNGDALLRGGISSPALGDIDNDGLPEVVVGTMSPPWDPSSGAAPDYNKGTIWAINGDSTNVPGWPVTTEQYINSSPALGDIDKDGQLEIVVGSGRGAAGRENLVYVFQADGHLRNGWPAVTQATMEAPPALADIDKDGKLEVIIGCGWNGGYNTCGDGTAKLYALNDDGTRVPGFPMQPQLAQSWVDRTQSRAMPFSPVVADIDGDGDLEILVTQSQDFGLTVVSSMGLVESFRELSDSEGYLEAAPHVADIDKDGKMEIIVAGGATHKGGVDLGKIYIWNELGDAVVSKMPWPMNRKDIQRTASWSVVGGWRPSAGNTPVVLPGAQLLLLQP